MIYIVSDLEATCWNNSFSPYPQEIIEIGACKLNAYAELESEYSSLVKPKRGVILSQYCRQLTEITQIQIDQARPFKIVWDEFMEWIEEDSDDFVLITWGKKDFDLMSQDCTENNCSKEPLLHYVDLKVKYHELKLNDKAFSLNKSLKLEQIEMDGVEHRALADAKNLAKLFIKYFDHWKF